MSNGKIRFVYSPKAQDAAIPAVAQLYDYAGDFAQMIDNLVPEGRQKSLAFTNLEQALLWAQRALESER